MKLAEMETKVAELRDMIASERAARMELETKLAESSKILERRISKETCIRKRKYDELEGLLEDKIVESNEQAQQELDAKTQDIEDVRNELYDLLEKKELELPKRTGDATSTSIALRRWWNECTEPSEDVDGCLWAAEELLPKFREWAKKTGHDSVRMAGLFGKYTSELVGKGYITSLRLVDKLEKLDSDGKKKKRQGFVGRRLLDRDWSMY